MCFQYREMTLDYQFSVGLRYGFQGAQEVCRRFVWKEQEFE